MRWRRPTAEELLVVVAAAEPLTLEGPLTALRATVCAAALLSLALRRRLPATALCLALPSMLSGALWLPAMVAMFHVACGRSRGRTAAACGLLFAVSACPWPPDELAAMTYQEVLISVEAAALMSTGPTALGLLARARAELRARLADLTATRAREQRLEAERAVARERARLAREMHDTIAHHVGIIAVQSGALRAAETDDAWKRDTAESIRRHGVRALEELRDLVGVLRASDGGAARAAGGTGLAALRDLTGDSLLDVAVDVTEPGAAPPPEVECAVFRVVQESLSNVRKHAPGARVAVRVAPAPDGGALEVEVRNGAPPAPVPAAGPPDDALPGGGYGLVGLRERAELLGGSLTAGPRPDGGFAVRAVLPL
ncbi:sensor histidine kinase [Streptomyces fradiae]|uniref:sensor histidine kinase n=1 Tax=Streptomyces fradiae TaxID=1906 RepID=UPI003987BEB9